MTTTMQAAQISKPRGAWELVERVIPEPRPGHVRVKVEACGMCHSDVLVTELQTLGGARVILATAPSAPAISALMDGLSPSGTLLVPAAPAEPLTISVLSLISGRRSVAGWYAGTARVAEDTLEFSWLSAVHPMIETYPLGRVAEAYEQMHRGRVRFRAVLTFDE